MKISHKYIGPILIYSLNPVCHKFVSNWRMNLLFDEYFICRCQLYISLVHEDLNHCKDLFKAVVLLLLIYCFMYFPLFVGALCLSLFCYALLCVHSS